MATRVFPTIDECIYCGSTVGLQDEHIIPHGLGGTLVLPRSSCSKCAAITSGFELRLLRGSWWPHRRRLGLPSRRPAKQPDEFPAILKTAGSEIDISIPAAETPGMVILDFDPPSILKGAHITGPPIAHRVFYKQTAVPFAGRPVIVRGILPGPTADFSIDVNLDVADFVRLLAKAALAYAVGARGLAAFDTIFLRTIILGDANGANTYIGSASSPILAPLLPGRELHALADRQHDGFLAVYIQLFREKGDPPPIYEVVVGTRADV